MGELGVNPRQWSLIQREKCSPDLLDQKVGDPSAFEVSWSRSWVRAKTKYQSLVYRSSVLIFLDLRLTWRPLLGRDRVSEVVNILCMKWGAKYGPEFTNRLFASVQRNLSLPFRFVCMTDDPTGLVDGIETLPIPDIRVDEPYHNLPWRKLAVYVEKLGDLSGKALFLDVDLLICDSLDKFFDYEGNYCVIRNWTKPELGIGNTSVFRFEIGAHTDVLKLYESKPTQHWVDEYRIEQTFLSRELPEITFWPDDWVVSFKRHCLPGGIKFPRAFLNYFKPSFKPENASIVVFHGHPNPDDAIAGRWPGGPHKRLLPAKWIADYWRD